MKSESSLVRRFLFDVVVRPLMFVLLASVFWGTAMLATWVVSVARRGLAETWHAIRPQEMGLWSTANLVLPLFAMVVWMLAALAWWQRRAAERHEEAR
jgi:hypothetical protein